MPGRVVEQRQDPPGPGDGLVPSRERAQFVSRAGLLEAGKNELVGQVEKLQAELKLRRQIEDQSEADFKSQLKEIVERHTSGQDQVKQLQDENGRLKKLVAELTLDRAMLQDVLRNFHL